MSEKSRHIDLDLDDLEESRDGGKRLVWLLAAVLFVIFSVLSLIIVSANIPFEPLKIYSYTADTADVCPFDRRILQQDIEFTDKWYYSLGRLQGETYALDSSDKPYGEIAFDIPVEAMPRTVAPSNTVRLAPPEAGQWTSAGEGTLSGRMFGIVPVEQVIPRQETEPYTVLAFNDEKCADKFSFYKAQAE